MSELTLIKRNPTEWHYTYNGVYAGFISKSPDMGRMVYYAFPAGSQMGKRYSDLPIAKVALFRAATGQPLPEVLS